MSVVPDRHSSTAVFLSDDLSLLVCGPYVYENDTPQECFLEAKMSLSSFIASTYVCVCVFSDGRKLFDVVHFPCVPLIITAALCVIMNALLLLLREPRLPC